ncbi:hypothetical protein PDIDSM_6905 [Penicillium digitatum]|nr:hypothetical protein PDIDSM_6905 [Penicillium digitatum]
MFATQSPQTPFRQTHTPTRPSPLSKHNTTPRWTMSPTRSMQSASQSTASNPFDNPPPTFNIQTEPITRHTHNHHSPIPMNFTVSVSASTTPTSSNPFALRTQTPTSPSSPTRQTPKPKYAARYASTIANPLQRAAGLARSNTRQMFLNRVRHERDDGRFEARGEQMMRMEHLADRRRWEESMARDGRELFGVVEVDDTDALDEFISQEEAMEMALMDTHSGVPARVGDLRSTGPGVLFSDDEYDDIFIGLSDPRADQCQSQSQDMDMS